MVVFLFIRNQTVYVLRELQSWFSDSGFNAHFPGKTNIFLSYFSSLPMHLVILAFSQLKSVLFNSVLDTQSNAHASVQISSLCVRSWGNRLRAVILSDSRALRSLAFRAGFPFTRTLRSLYYPKERLLAV